MTMWRFYQRKHITQHESHHFQKIETQFKHFLKYPYTEVEKNNAILDFVSL